MTASNWIPLPFMAASVLRSFSLSLSLFPSKKSFLLPTFFFFFFLILLSCLLILLGRQDEVRMKIGNPLHLPPQVGFACLSLLKSSSMLRAATLSLFHLILQMTECFCCAFIDCCTEGVVFEMFPLGTSFSHGNVCHYFHSGETMTSNDIWLAFHFLLLPSPPGEVWSLGRQDGERKWPSSFLTTAVWRMPVE